MSSISLLAVPIMAGIDAFVVVIAMVMVVDRSASRLTAHTREDISSKKSSVRGEKSNHLQEKAKPQDHYIYPIPY